MNWWHLRPLTLAEMPLCNTRWLGYLIGVAGSVLVLLAWRMLGPDLAASQQWIAQLTTVLGGILLAIGGVLVFETTVGQR
ncbi:MAG: hypothetical protein KGH75_00540 [Rhodospirillales bacterium]|nr:hypothetical protein [Rhodospirillales bacterium]